MSVITETLANLADQVKEKIHNLVSKDNENNQDEMNSPELERRLALEHPDTLAPPAVDPPIARRDSLPPSPRPSQSPIPQSHPLPISPRSNKDVPLLFEPTTLVLAETSPDTLAPPPLDPPIQRRDSLPPSPRPEPDNVDSIRDPSSDVQLIVKPGHHQQSDVQTLQMPGDHSKPIEEHDAKEIPPVIVQSPPPIENEKDLTDYVPRPASIEDRKGDEKKTEKNVDQGEKEGLSAYPPPLRVKDLADDEETFEVAGYRGTSSKGTQPPTHNAITNKIVELKEDAKASIHQGVERVKDAFGVGEKEHSINPDASYPVATTKY